MIKKTAQFACAVAVFGAVVGNGARAQGEATAPIPTLQDAAEAHARGDYAGARAIFQSLAEQGNVTAQFDLAVMNADGRGAPANMQEALKWYRAAAEQGDAESFVNLATLFENGSGVPIDYVKAYLLLDAGSRVARGNAAQAVRVRRDSLAGKMATNQLIQAQDLARQCQAESVKACIARIATDGPYTPGNQALDTPMMIKLEQSPGGTFLAPVTVNGNMNLKFEVDSGAGDVSIPADVLMALMDSGSVSKSDFIREGMVTLADGSKRKTQFYRLRSLKLGDLVLDNVVVTTAPAKAPLLLGQSFLSRLKSWSLDNATHTLVVK